MITSYFKKVISHIRSRHHCPTNPVKIFWWQPSDCTSQNFGDKLGPEIVKRIFHQDYLYSDIETCDLVTIGSILDIINDIEHILNIDREILVWGSGLIQPFDESTDFVKNLHYFAVRGCLTRDALHLPANLPLGDPGLLSSLAYPHITKNRDKRYCVIPHHAEMDLPIIQRLKTDRRFKIISPLNEPEFVINEIQNSSGVFSSSLHGLIVADSFGIPNARLKLSNRITGGDFKFLDYCSGVSISKIIFSPDQLLDSDSTILLLKKYEPIQNLKTIQNRLIDSFPIR